MLKVIDVSKGYSGQVLFEKISFNVNPGERVGLVGRNGTGKTTLLRLIIGEEEADKGVISIPKNYRIGHVSQHLNFTQKTVFDEVCTGLPHEYRNEKWMAEKILFGLGFKKEDLLRHWSEFSGGYRVRINLAKVLVNQTNLLLLDEPTNYLDIVSLRWLESFLKSWKGELILITHDRSFMDRVVTHTIGIHRKKIRKIKGSTQKLYEQIAQDEEVYEKTRLNDSRKIKELEKFVTRFRAKARLSSQAKSKQKIMNRIEEKKRLEKIEDLEFFFPFADFPGKQLAEISKLRFSYTKKSPWLIENLSLNIHHGDRIGIIGKNGKGKSTLLKLLSQNLTPESGNIHIHPKVQIGYFGQIPIENLHPQHTILDEIALSEPDKSHQKTRSLAAAMLFKGDAALKKISVLSGGEKCRVTLAKLLAKPSNILLLDEPTNHLDMSSCDSLLEAIENFEGTVVMVTHNELFLHNIVNRLVVFDETGVSVFEGTYAEWLEKVGWSEEESRNQNEITKPETNKKEQRKKRADFLKEKNRILNPLKEKVLHIEETINRKEEELSSFHEELLDASKKNDGNRIANAGKKIKTLQSEIDKLFEKFETATLELEEKEMEFSNLE